MSERERWTGDRGRETSPWWGTGGWYDRLFEFIPWKWPQRIVKTAVLAGIAFALPPLLFWLVDLAYGVN